MKYNILNIEVFCHDSHVFPFNHKYFKILPHISVHTGKFKSTIILESETDKVFADPADMLEIILDILDSDNNLVNNNKRQYCSTTNESEIDLKNGGIIDKNKLKN
ncbi:hypothetical protein H312_02262 [Anncaliia algerae PRA339]|uniref:Uncharacterized protein n=1 Tax=Anncaliia algerae PRA339 TaxID=1288291 RepID=A0A059EZK6_9MICR|nr:hypothetical protein H312_02262 [Anncaliia algerae PRA339]